MELSVFDLSKHLGVAPTTIERWVRQGKLPVFKTGTHYRFRTNELAEWAARHNIRLNLSGRAEPEKKNDEAVMLSEAVKNGGIYFGIRGDDVKTVLDSCLDQISTIPDDFKADLLTQLVEREQALSTGIGNGIAIPHPRSQLAYLQTPLVPLCFLEKPVDYNSLDQVPVSVLFFLLCPSLKLHLHLLSVLSFCLRNTQFRKMLESCPEPDQIIEQIELLEKTNPI
jgi:PTS system nitrogen regulatory IIA component